MSRRCLLWVLAACAAPLFLPAPPARAQDGGAAPARAAGLATDRLNRSQACGQCHSDIYKAWQDSLHARSFTDPIFQAALEKVGATEGPQSRRVCLSCHAPAVVVNNDYEAKEDVTREGISCDFCHSIKSVDLARKPGPFEIQLGGIKRGPFQYLESPAHETEYSTLHRNSPLLCAGCHQYSNDTGMAVLDTYTEWSQGPYPALGVSCQDCHMAVVPGQRVRPGMAAPQSQRIINLHRLVGGSSLSQLRRGLEAALDEVRREGGSVVAKIEVRNVAAGHKVPTGLPTKQVRLKVTASQGGKEIFSAERVYARVLVDDKGKQATTDEQVFFGSRRASSDSRLGPRESRVEMFRIPAPPGEIDVTAQLLYEYRPFTGGQPVEETIQKLETKVSR